MRRLDAVRRGVMLVFLLTGLQACANVHARTVPAGPLLETPPPPPRVIVPVPAEPVALAPAPVEDVPAPAPAPRPPRAATPRTERPGPAPAAASPRPSAEGSTPPRSLQTTANMAEAEQQVRALLARASQDLGRIEYRTLSVEARAQYDIAKRFISQAEEALKDRNPVFAGKLADKAAALAGLLLVQ